MLSLSGCSVPVMFSVSVDEEIRGGTLTLNGKRAPLMRNVDGAYWAKWEGSDASGTIEVVFPDGGKAVCEIGYVTHGMTDVQAYEVIDRTCTAVAEGFQ
jgi:hypothetical protein